MISELSLIVVLALLMILGCGDDAGDPPGSNTQDLSTLAYVTTSCRDGREGLSGRQSLVVRRGTGETSVVMEIATASALRIVGACSIFGTNRFGFGSVAAGVFQRLGVSPDGTTVVFESTPEFSILPLQVADENTGIFAVSADGEGLRRLGPASAQSTFSFLGDDLASIRNSDPLFEFSPNGKTVAFTDLGPGPRGEMTTQVILLDIDTGARRQITSLPHGPSPFAFDGAPGTCCPRFVDARRVVFATTANADGRHPGGLVVQYLVDIEAGGAPTPFTTATPPGISVLPVFGISGGADRGALLILLPSAPANAFPPGTAAYPGYPEVFQHEAQALRRVTALRHVDTFGPLLDRDGDDVFFVSSADLENQNPTAACQVFSASLETGELRQLTHFTDGDVKSAGGCYFGGPPGCSSLFLFQDAHNGRLVFYSSCDPFGSNPYGGQIFSMRSDGSDLQQLTSAAGMQRRPDGTTLVELPGPFAYPIAPRGAKSEGPR